MYRVYSEGNVSNFVNGVFGSDVEDANTVMNFIYNDLLTFLDDGIIFNHNQPIITESDLKCILYNRLMTVISDLDIETQIHSELADKKVINANCDCFGQINGNTLVRTDITITLEPNLIAENHGIRKSFTLNGLHIDFELKYIRKNFESAKLREIKKDLCKLKCLVYGDSPLDEENLHGRTICGISIVLFENQEILERYIHNDNYISLLDEINAFQNQNNLYTLLVYKEMD